MVGAIQANDDLLQIGHLRQNIDNLVQRRTFQLGIERRQYQPHGVAAGKYLQLVFKFGQFALREIVKVGDDAILIKITHGEISR